MPFRHALFRFRAAFILSVLCLGAGAAQAADAAATARPVSTALTVEGDPRATYAALDLAQAVPGMRTTDGSRTIFEPRPVRFTARLAQLPAPQKADYLKKVMGLIGVTAELKVSQRVALDYGGDKPLAAYVEDGAAARIAKDLKAGDERVFYAFHVYNNRYGPALVITAFDE
ncbi:MAG: hypothetical protein LBF61_01510 [Azoarcus sp.]|jgi:hypothetical protein|nr:hypothetical protein [Azoarcus sp.]